MTAMVLAGFFTSFLLYLVLGLLALAVTAALDRALGKERALLLWAVAVLGLTWALRPTPPPAVMPKPKPLDLAERLDPSRPLVAAGEVFSREPLARADRNAFEEQSDTSALPPVLLAAPPPVPLAFPLPPTVPGVGPEARRLYRGAVPSLKTGDGSKLPDVPEDAFSAYVPKPEDVFDWVMEGGQRYYVYIREIDDLKEGTKEFEDPRGPKWCLALQDGPPAFAKPWQSLRVTLAAVGPEDDAKKVVGSVKKARNLRVSTVTADQHAKWFLRRSVDNLFAEACRRQGSPRLEELGVDALRLVAADMAKVGATGKEEGAGWRRAIQALELALQKCQQPPARNPSDVLLALVEAYRETHDENRLLATLSGYLGSTQGTAAAADGATWLGDVFLDRLELPGRAEALYDRALAAQPGSRAALQGRGDARARQGDWRDALKDYRAASEAGARGELAVREAEANLALGNLAEAKTAAEAALSADSFDARALLVKGAVLYAQGDVQGARDTFAQASALPGEGPAGASARRHRSEALYDLGLSEWRLAHGDAALAAFDAADRALRGGASLGRSADERVCPELGRVLVQLAQGNVAEAVDALDRARTQAPGMAYLDMLGGWIAQQQGDAAKARAQFEAALRLEPDLYELDGWLSETRLALAEAATAEGRPAAESAADFEAAIKFAERAAAREAQANPKNTDFAVREALAKLRAQDQSERARFTAALKTATGVLERVREERRALAVKGYCNYRLGAYDSALYDQCLRDFQQVLDVAAPEGDPVRAYVAATREQVITWLSLEEKVVTFSEAKLSNEWTTLESQGIRVGPDDGWLVFRDTNTKVGATQDGSSQDPTVVARARKLFNKDTLELLQVWASIPKTDREGVAQNNVTFGVVVQPGVGDAKGLAKNQGVGLFYDKGKVAVRVGGGSDPLYKDGELHRVVKDGQEVDWPDDPSGLGVLVEIERPDREGTVVLRLGGQEVLKDRLPSFKRSKGDAELWIGGWSNKAQNWNLKVDKVRVVRRKS